MTTQIHQRLEGKRVFVTGAGTGFGRTLAVRAALEGAAHIGVHFNRSRQGAESTAVEVERLGASATLYQADISSWNLVAGMATAAFEDMGGVDVLVNNVGDIATEQMSWRDVTQELIDRVIDVDVKGTLYMLHEFGSRMLEQGGGCIINIGSTVIVRGSPRAPQYAAGKYGVLGLTKSYAAAFAPTVRVNAFAPGFMETESTLAREDWQTGRREKLIASTPAGRIPAPEELAGAALFLATDEAAHVIGSYFIADGGYSMVGA